MVALSLSDGACRGCPLVWKMRTDTAALHGLLVRWTLSRWFCFSAMQIRWIFEMRCLFAQEAPRTDRTGRPLAPYRQVNTQ